MPNIWKQISLLLMRTQQMELQKISIMIGLPKLVLKHLLSLLPSTVTSLVFFIHGLNYCVFVNLKTLCNCLCYSSSSCFPDNHILVFGIGDVNMADRGGEFGFFQGIHPYKIWYRNRYLHFDKIYEIWEPITKSESSSRCWWRHYVKIMWQAKTIISPIPDCL